MAINPKPNPEHAIGPRDRSPLPDDLEIAPGIVVNPAVRHGKPRFVGTRLTVAEVLTKLRAGQTWGEITYSWPLLTDEDIRRALTYAAALADAISVPVALRTYPAFTEVLRKALRDNDPAPTADDEDW